MCETQLTWPKSCFCVYKPFDGHEITLLKFMSAPSQKIALVTSNNLVRKFVIDIKKYSYKSKNIFIQMLNDVRMTVLIFRETSTVHPSTFTENIFTLVYAAGQGMMACNNKTMLNPSLHLLLVGGYTW